MPTSPAFQEQLLAVITKIRDKYPFYGRRAYIFLYETVGYTIKTLKLSDNQQVNAQSLLEGFRSLVKETFGLMALDVLNYWKVHTCSDVGHIVEHLVEFGVLRKEASDSFDDFTRYAFDFKQAFGHVS